MYTSDERELKSDRLSVTEPPPGDCDTVTVTASEDVRTRDESKSKRGQQRRQWQTAERRESSVERASPHSAQSVGLCSHLPIS